MRISDWSSDVCSSDLEFATVPNIHYNQPAAWRIDALRWQADRNDERARSHDEAAGREPWRAHEAKMAREQAARLRAMADAMERDGNGRKIAADTGLPPWTPGKQETGTMDTDNKPFTPPSRQRPWPP